MAYNGGLDAGDSLEGGESFSQLLFSSSNDNVLALDTDGCFNYASSVISTANPQKMLCFGDYQINNNESDLSGFAQKSGLTCSDSSSASSTNNTNPLLCKSKKKRNGRVSEPVAAFAGALVGGQGNGKKTKLEKPTAAGHAKGNKQSIGERIAALQQLVSPFGKTDTASVLHEAQGYIRFLQDQVQVLCSPYLQSLPRTRTATNNLHHEGEEGGENGGKGETGKDLRSSGLCLVPVESTLHVANSNGADFWLPAMKTNATEG